MLDNINVNMNIIVKKSLCLSIVIFSIKSKILIVSYIPINLEGSISTAINGIIIPIEKTSINEEKNNEIITKYNCIFLLLFKKLNNLELHIWHFLIIL